jgi:hypothetical protein
VNTNRDTPRKAGACTKNRELGVVLAMVHRVWPLASLALALLKRFKRIALRCEKTAQNYGSFVALALGFILIKTVHTA